MTHEQLERFEIYRKACFGSKAMCFCLVNHVEEHHGLLPIASESGYLQWQPNFALIQTLGVRSLNLTINVSGREANYRGLGLDDLFRRPRTGLTRIRFTSAGQIGQLVAVIDRAFKIKTRA
jgi:hypothetical protein